MTTQSKVFSAVVALQVIFLVAMPAGQYAAGLWGHTIYLRVKPVDPFHVLSGYYAQLNYDICTPIGIENFEQMPDGTDVYTVVVPDPEGISTAVRAELSYPEVLHGNEHVILGTKKGNGLVFAGIMERHINEEAREAVDQGLRDPNADCRAEVRLDKHGNPSLHGLHIGNKKY